MRLTHEHCVKDEGPAELGDGGGGGDGIVHFAAVVDGQQEQKDAKHGEGRCAVALEAGGMKGGPGQAKAEDCGQGAWRG